MKDFRPLVGRRVLVFTSDMTFDGTLARATDAVLVLEAASAVAEGGDRRPIDGEAWIPSLAVEWVQVP